MFQKEFGEDSLDFRTVEHIADTLLEKKKIEFWESRLDGLSIERLLAAKVNLACIKNPTETKVSPPKVVKPVKKVTEKKVDVKKDKAVKKGNKEAKPVRAKSRKSKGKS